VASASHIDYRSSIAANVTVTAVATPTLVGGAEVSRIGTAIALVGTSVGSAIALGPGYHDVGDAVFTVDHATDYVQPFTVTLGGGRSLTGDEEWRASIRKTKSGAVLATFESATLGGTGITIDGSNQPSIVFTPASFANIPAGSEGEYFYDLEMKKGSHFETYAVDTLTIRVGRTSTAWSVVRGDHYLQPFTVSLDQSRTLDGQERWFARFRTSPGATPSIEWSSAGGSIKVDPVTHYPSLVFTPDTVAAIVAGEDQAFVWDVRMSKDGKFESMGYAGSTIIGDLTR
jgi:hypothetical protein